MGISQICNRVPYWASYSGAMRVLSVRPNLASYQTDASKNDLGVNKLHRLVDYLGKYPRSFSPEERHTIRGMIFTPMLGEQNYKLQALAQKGINQLNKIEKQKPPIDVLTLDFPVPEREAVPPPAPPVNSERNEPKPPAEIKEQGRSAIDTSAISDATEKEARPLWIPPMPSKIIEQKLPEEIQEPEQPVRGEGFKIEVPDVPEIKEDNSPATPTDTETEVIEFNAKGPGIGRRVDIEELMLPRPQGPEAQTRPELIQLKPIDPTKQIGMRPQIVWQFGEEPQVSIAEADLNRTEGNK